MNVQISPLIYELASNHNVGIPFKRYKKLYLQIILVILLMLPLVLVGWLCYNIYGYIAFISISHTYPDIKDVPTDQVYNYIQLQSLHDGFWKNGLQEIAILLTVMGSLSSFYLPFRTELYLCSDGLLKVYKQKGEAIRWDEVTELYMTGSYVTKLVKQDGSSFELPKLLMAGIDKTIGQVISDEVTRCLLPSALVRYECGEALLFGNMVLDQQGLSGPYNMVYWDRLGAISLEKGRLSVYYSADILSHTSIAKWHVRQKDRSTSPPNLSILVALVNTILDQRGSPQAQEILPSQPPQSLREAAAIAKYRNKKRKRIQIVVSITSILILCSLGISSIAYFSTQDQQRNERDIRLIQNYYTKLARQAYFAHVPGSGCDHGKGTWENENAKNTFVCQKDGLRMTQLNIQYQDEMNFSFASGFSSIDTIYYFPHHYRIQINAKMVELTEEYAACVAVHVHIQDYGGRQYFTVCTDGSWGYYWCNVYCNSDIQMAAGNLPQAKNSYLIAVDVTDSVLTLIVDNAKVTSIQDSSYSSTNQITLAVFGYSHVNALFSDFLYTPYP